MTPGGSGTHTLPRSAYLSTSPSAEKTEFEREMTGVNQEARVFTTSEVFVSSLTACFCRGRYKRLVFVRTTRGGSVEAKFK